MSDWQDATDPTQPVRERELSIAEKRRRLALRKIAKREWLRPGADAVSTYHIDDDFENTGA